MNDKRLPSDKLAGMAFGEALEKLANTDPKEAAAVTNESMKDGATEKLIAKFEDAAEVDDEGTEFWTARGIQKLLVHRHIRKIQPAATPSMSFGHDAVHHPSESVH